MNSVRTSTLCMPQDIFQQLFTDIRHSHHLHSPHLLSFSPHLLSSSSQLLFYFSPHLLISYTPHLISYHPPLNSFSIPLFFSYSPSVLSSPILISSHIPLLSLPHLLSFSSLVLLCSSDWHQLYVLSLRGISFLSQSIDKKGCRCLLPLEYIGAQRELLFLDQVCYEMIDQRRVFYGGPGVQNTPAIHSTHPSSDWLHCLSFTMLNTTSAMAVS